MRNLRRRFLALLAVVMILFSTMTVTASKHSASSSAVKMGEVI